MERLLRFLLILFLSFPLCDSAVFASEGADKGDWNQLYASAYEAYEKGHYQEAEQYLQSALFATAGNTDKELITLEGLSDLYHETEDYAAEKQILISLTRVIRSIDRYPQVNLADTYLKISSAEFFMKDYVNAEKNATLALTILRGCCSPRSTNIALALNNLAWIELKAKSPEKAEQHFRQALTILSETAGAKTLVYGLVAENLAASYAQKGDRKSALTWYRNARKAASQVLPAEDPMLADLDEQCKKLQLPESKKKLARQK